MKLFVYHTVYEKPKNIHAIKDSLRDALCGAVFLDDWDEYSIDHLDTTKPFCQDCTEILKDDYNIDIKQLAINQKLGVKV